jgi:hypothetical protein
MVAFYVFSLVLGGGFLGLSLLGDIFGGHAGVDLSTDTSVDTDLGLDAHLEADTGSLDGDAGPGEVDQMHLEGGHGVGDAGHAASIASKIFSIRTVTYSLFGFGAVGTLLTYVFHAGSPVTAAFAVAGGVVSGTIINAAFGWVRRSESGSLAGEDTYSGHSGHITLPIAGTGGKVVVEHLGHTVELRALPHPGALDQGDPSGWRSVVVVEMKKGVALVAPVSKDLLGP